MKILVVDDSHAMRRVVKTYFANAGFRNLQEAEEGAQALEIIRNQAVKLVVSDLNMPGMDGFELLKAVREDSRTRDIPFIILTVEAIQKNMNKALAMRADSYIVKPVSEKIFIDEVLRVLRVPPAKEP